MQERSPAGPHRSGEPVRIPNRQPEPSGAALSPDLGAAVRRLVQPGVERGRSSPEAVLRLQSEAGNRAVRRALGRAPAKDGEVPPEVEDGIQRARGAGTPLDTSIRSRMEPAFGSDFSGVRIHTGTEADRLNQAVSARAFTTGRDIFFRQGEYDPGSSSGRELLAHELTHVVQQGGNGTAVQGKLTLGPADDAYEREADRTARAVVRREAASGSCCAGKKEEEHCADCRANAAIQRAIEEEQFPGEEVEQAAGDAPNLMRAPYGLQRSCRSAPCPAVAVPVDALFPLYEAAEKCIQTLYAQDHPEAQRNVSLSFNLDWMYISGKGPQQKMALSCLRGLPGPGGPNYTAKGGMRGAEPDIWDFENRTIYEITTASGVGLRAGKVNWECELANRLCEPAECGGLTFRPGGWAPAGPCYKITADLYFRVVNNGGVLVYQVLKDATKETLTAVALAAIAAALKKSGGTGAKSAGGKLIPAYAIASLVAAVILVSSGKAEAKAGPGDQEPLAQLFQALAEKGTTVPPEIQKMLDENPEIKEKVTKALAQGGDATAAQKALNEEILKVIADNKDQFTAEDLELILATTGMAGPALPKQDVTASSVQTMLDQIRSGQTYQPGQTGQLGQSGSGTPSKPPAAGAATSQTGGDKPVSPAAPGAQPGARTDDTPAAAPATPDSKMEPLAPGVKAKITGAPAPVKGLFDAMTAKTGSGLPLGNAEVERFFAAVPADLTEAESNALRARLGEVQGHNLDQVLKGLETALQELRKKRTQQATGSTQSQGVMDESAEKAANDSSSDTETVGKLAKIAKGTQTPASQFRLTWSKEKDGRIHAVLTSRTAEGVGLAAWVTAKVVRQDANTLEVEGLSSTPLVSATGQVVKPAGFFAGRKETLVRDKPKKK